MNESNPKSAVEFELKRLEKRLEDLIATVAQNVFNALSFRPR